MQKNLFDTIVIGAGSAGVSFARNAARLGAKVLIIEREHLGGTCVNRGCVPKKILWAAGSQKHAIDDLATQEIASKNSFDFTTLVRKRDAHILDLRQIYERNLADAGAKLVRGDAVMVDARTVRVADTEFKAKQTVIATGSRPTEIDIPGAEHLQDSNDVLAWKILPASIAIIGGGYIGCEFAAIFRAFDVNVTLIHDGPYVLDTFPKDLAQHVQEGLIASGIEVLTEDSVTAVAEMEGGLEYTCRSGNKAMAQAVVCAIGRTPNTDSLGSFAQDLKTAESGALDISSSFETSASHVFAIGDVADRLPLTPVATADGAALARMLHGDGGDAIDLDLVATTTFVYPPAAFVGDIGDAPAMSDKVTPLEANVLSPSADYKPDFYQFGASESGAITGAAITGHGAADMIGLLAAAIASGQTQDSYRRATPVHPSFTEEFFSE